MNPLGALLTFAFAAVILTGSRINAVLGLLAGVCYLTQGQSIEVAGFNLTAIRILLLVAALRVSIRREFSPLRLNRIDKVFLAYALTITVIGTLRNGLAAVAYEFGFLYNVILSYGIVRSLVRSMGDLCSVLVGLALLIVPLAVLMTFENITHRNSFSAFGGVSSEVWIREQAVRSMGSFRNPITAGSFGTTLAPLFAALIFSRIAIRPALIGLLGSTAIVITAHSSGPLMAYIFGGLALALWHWRHQMRAIRWALVIGLVGLHLIMKAPVWFLIGRISDVVGGGGYHRAYLIDRFIREFGSWWLIGTNDTGDWMPTQLEFGTADITNQFVSDGINGGIWGLFLAILFLTRCFQGLGRSLQPVAGASMKREKMLWCLGVALFVHIVNQFSVTYFDQMHVMWYFQLAVISSITTENVSVPQELLKSRDSLACSVLPSPV